MQGQRWGGRSHLFPVTVTTTDQQGGASQCSVCACVHVCACVCSVCACVQQSMGNRGKHEYNYSF